MPKVKPPDQPPVPRRLSDEIKLEIAHYYQDQRIPIHAIQRAYGISPSSMFAVVDELGVARRGMGSGSGRNMHGQFVPDPTGQWKNVWLPAAEPEPTSTFAEPANNVSPEPVPESHLKALENMLTEPDRTTVPPRLQPRPEPVAPTPDVQRRVQQPAPGWGPRWVIRVEGELTSNLDDISEVVAAVKKKYPNLRIIAINPA